MLFLIPLFVVSYLFLNNYQDYYLATDTIDLGFWGYISLSNLIGSYIPWVSGFLVLINAYLLNFFFNSNDFYEKNSYIISLLYVILLSYFRSFYFLDGLLISHTFLILALIQLFQLDYSQDGKKNTFNAGFFVGIAATFHPSLVLALPFVWFMITRIRPFVFRETFLCTLGLVVPLLYAFSFNFIYKNVINFNFIEATVNYESKEIIFLSALGLFVFLVLTSMVGIRNKAQKSSIRFRKHTNMLYLFLLFGIALGAIDYIFFQQYEWFCFIVIPISLFLPFSYLNVRFKFGTYFLFYITFFFSVIKFFIYSF